MLTEITNSAKLPLLVHQKNELNLPFPKLQNFPFLSGIFTSNGPSLCFTFANSYHLHLPVQHFSFRKSSS